MKTYESFQAAFSQWLEEHHNHGINDVSKSFVYALARAADSKTSGLRETARQLFVALENLQFRHGCWCVEAPPLARGHVKSCTEAEQARSLSVCRENNEHGVEIWE